MQRILVLLAALLAYAGFAFGAVNINSATQEQLESLNGIGPVKAKAIIDYRNKNGRFKTLEDIKKVDGIGDATFDKIRGDIQLTGTTVVPKDSAKPATDRKEAPPKMEKAAAPKEERMAAPARESKKAAAKEEKVAAPAKEEKKAATKDEKKAATKDEKKAAADKKADAKKAAKDEPKKTSAEKKAEARKKKDEEEEKKDAKKK